MKAAYQEVLEKLLSIFEAELGGPRAREQALVLVALCVGGTVLARGLDDPALADDIRGAAYQHTENRWVGRRSQLTGGVTAAALTEIHVRKSVGGGYLRLCRLCLRWPFSR